ncbi:hypothetical protein [Hymenobacter cheonanensis]|uniref:hypothetical protein n=1 Tax=Hymenobacter sp. CA2-7 TaxID=3063993 RepID=UPI00271443E8|nr:hypothetical protein [Hymenobacter sp. CA2-7]MDO7887346.1 hypothetical protein [Hymenobacter sp. CA2-7]
MKRFVCCRLRLAHLQGLVLVASLLASQVGAAQIVKFTKPSYVAGETVQATIIGSSPVLIANDFSQASEPRNQGDVVLGRPAKAGFYRIDCTFSDKQRVSSLLLVADPARRDGFVLQGPVNVAAKTTYARLFTQLEAYLKASPRTEWQVPLQSAANNFLRNNAVAAGTNVAFCLSMVSGVPVVTTVCYTLTRDNLLSLSKEVHLALIERLKLKKYLTDAEAARFKADIDLLDKLDIFSPEKCDRLAAYLQLATDSPDLKLMIDYQKQLCSTIVMLIEKK